MSDSIDYKQAGPATVLVHAGRHRNKEHRFVNPPIVKGSTVLHESVKDMIEREAVSYTHLTLPTNSRV